VTPSTPEAEDDFDPTVAADLDTDADVTDLATDPLDAVLAAEGDAADLDDGLDEELEVDLDADDLDLDEDEDEDEDEDLDVEVEDLEDDDELEDDATDGDEELDPTATDGTDDDGVTPAVALDPAFEEDDEDLATVVVGDDDEDEDVDGLRDGEFVCRSCFLAKRDTQLADPERMLCRDCA
jgi:hypothetical protein